MKITIFTSNSTRHNYLCSFLSKYATELFIIQEVDTRFIGLKEGEYPKSKIGNLAVPLGRVTNLYFIIWVSCGNASNNGIF